MKIKVTDLPLEEVLKLQPEKRFAPTKIDYFWYTLVRALVPFEVNDKTLNLKKVDMDKLGKNQPCLILQNHTSFLDPKITQKVMYPRPINIVTTYDAFVGLKWVLRKLGCFPTRKFVPEVQTLKDMAYCVNTLKTSVVMFPEAGYNFDGTTTTLPENLGRLVKLLGVPLVTIISKGADLIQPLFNRLLKRKVRFETEVKFQLSTKQIQEMSAEEITKVINDAFSYDSYKWQQENNVIIDEPNRALGLERVLYKCPHCNAEEQTVGENSTLTCKACGKQWELTETGYMKALDGETEFSHIPDWFNWERECVRTQLESGEYLAQTEVDLYAQINTKTIYKTGEAILTQNMDGLFLHDKQGNLIHHQPPLFSHTINADFYWYEIDDIIGLGTEKIYYTCAPKNHRNFVTKARLVAEELYKLKKIKEQK